MKSPGKPAYAIIRFDYHLGDDVPLEEKVVAKAVYYDKSLAEKEVARLNELNAGYSSYHIQLTKVYVV